jgi:predicted acyltransferase
MPPTATVAPIAPASVSNPNSLLPNRLMSLDVYRGLAVAGMIIVDNPGSDDHAFWPIMHCQWNGWTPADLIFPSFLFLVGISLVFSFSSRLAHGQSRRQILLHAFKRSLILIAVGLLVNASPIYGFDLHSFRFEGVTQRIALCYFASAILELYFSRRGQLIAIAVCLLGYWAILRFVPVPGFGFPGRDIPFMDPDRNITAWLDRKLFMGHLYNGTRDPEGIIHTIPAIATTLFGVLTGHWLRNAKPTFAKIRPLLLIGVLCIVAGSIWNRWFPINKNLWTSSFVLLSGGFCFLFLSFFYWLIEIKNWRAFWTMPILVFGMNPILAYIADSLVYGPGYTFHARTPTGLPVLWHEAAQAHLEYHGLSTPWASLVYSLVGLAFCWLLLYPLYRKKIFLKA